MSTKINPTSVRLPADLKKKIEEKAKQEDRTFNSMVNWLLKNAVA